MSDVINLPDSWGFCGCANEDAIRLLRDILRKMDEKGPPMGSFSVPGSVERQNAWIREHIESRHKLAGGSAQWELFMHYIDKMGWSEHGGGINSSWLTPAGDEALRVLNGLDLEDPN
jgi:hypothetical protein